MICIESWEVWSAFKGLWVVVNRGAVLLYIVGRE